MDVCGTRSSLVLVMAMHILYTDITYTHTTIIIGTDALACYFCPRTAPGDDNDAYIECLAMGLELYCAPDQDRCYSRSYPGPPLQVAKGCTNSSSCVGRTSCCLTDLCNADPVNALAGHGSPCTDVAGCIQGPDVMTCDRRSPGDSFTVCLCRHDSYRRGATCRTKSSPDERCSYDNQCLDNNSTCISGRCRCSDRMFGNGTRCDPQKYLGENCTLHEECYGRHTQCNRRCVCQLGYLKERRTNTSIVVCSGEPRIKQTSYHAILTLVGIVITSNSSWKR